MSVSGAGRGAYELSLSISLYYLYCSDVAKSKDSLIIMVLLLWGQAPLPKQELLTYSLS